MKKVLMVIIVLSLSTLPSLVLASGIDQYGYYLDSQGTAHYGFIPEYPDYLSGYLDKPMSPYIFYQPEIPQSRLSDKNLVVFTPQLSNNPEQDQAFCLEAQVFAEGRYTMDYLNRISPVCAAPIELIEIQKINPEDKQYSNLPSYRSTPIEKIYPYHDYLNKKIFTSRPALEDIKWHLVQGATDPTLYYVDKENGEMVLQQIFPDKARSMFGEDYQSKIIYFSDSIIYSFKPGKTLW